MRIIKIVIGHTNQRMICLFYDVSCFTFLLENKIISNFLPINYFGILFGKLKQFQFLKTFTKNSFHKNVHKITLLMTYMTVRYV